MSLKNIEIQRSYRSVDSGNNTIPHDLINPCLHEAILYQRSVGYFSSSVFETIASGINSLVINNGKIQLITTPMLSEEDINAINLGYKVKDNIVSESFDFTFNEELEKMSNENLLLLFDLVANDLLEIKIATTKGNGEYHDKLGIIHDEYGNKVVFFGSANSSNNGYQHNYEKIRTARSWNEYESLTVKDEVDEFDHLWDNTNEFVDVVEYSEAAKNGVLRIVKKRGLQNTEDRKFELRDYQKEAIAAWKKNGYKGFFVMATGTGKTFTAIYGLKELLKSNRRIAVICAPYKHLVSQWYDDVIDVFPSAKTIMVSSENIGWEDQIKNELIKLKYNSAHQLIIISTIKSFQMKKFDDLMKKTKVEKVLIVDEAHRFTLRPIEIKERYRNMLGLSATPTNGKNIEESKALVNFFEGIVFNLPIETALDKKYLVPYNYYPIYVNSTEGDEELFSTYSRYMAGCFKNGVCIDKETLLKYSKKRLRLISNCQNKINQIENIILKNVAEKDHFVVYCGDGKLYNYDDDLRYINFVKEILNRNGYKVSQFTAKENMKERMELVQLFNDGLIDSLAAIRCLDEGINIPSIKSALLLSSNDDLKEFVQRRGRILRKYKNKSIANIYDVIVLPSDETPGMAKIELRRFYEYARLSNNYEDYIGEIERLVSYYGLDFEELLLNDMMFEEDECDE